jgi:hypothetical protein
MKRMTDPTPETPPATGPTPGERRLSHPPSDRYRVVEQAPAPDDAAATPMRGVALGVGAAIGGAAAITILGGVLAISSGLIVVAGATGWTVAAGLRAGAGASIHRTRRVRLAVALAVLAVALGQAGLWAYGRSEGGVLGPLDYLVETFGLLVPVEVAVAWIVAWISAR